MLLSVIGAGNMAGAIIKGLKSANLKFIDEIFVSDSDRKKAVRFEGVAEPISTNNEAVARADWIILAVKPNVMPEVLAEIKTAATGKVIVSIAAGVTIAAIKNILGSDAKVIRTMPNAPASVGAAMTAISYAPPIKADDVNLCGEIFGSIGQACVLPERMMDAAVSVAGSSPAFVFMLIEAMSDGAVRLGLPREQALQMACQAVYGSALMALQTGDHPARLKDLVTSPGGTTIEGLLTLEKAGFRGLIMDAMDACTKRSAEIGVGARPYALKSK